MNADQPTTAECQTRKFHPFRVWLVGLVLMLAYFNVGKGRFTFIVSWASTLPAWLKVVSGVIFYALLACVFVGMHRGVLLRRRIMHYSWLVAAVVSGFCFAACVADTPVLFAAVSLGVYLLNILCRGCVRLLSRKANRA